MKKIYINPYQKNNDNLLLATFVVMVCLIIFLTMILFSIRKEYSSQNQLWTANIELYEQYQIADRNLEKKEAPISQISLADLDQLMSVRSSNLNFDRLRYSLDGVLEVEGSCPELMDLTGFIDAAQTLKINLQIKRVARAEGGLIEFELERK
ncbi:hypothetical protein [Acinetobacter calcoaceticus]|uniref:hypothetical protein n=1 Tax=Acinetobacter calcoaceticus TaxID=471 RepID=UPI0002CFD422|nr:hypothetical protein [Acinetobacter calcoaceticus]ENU08463.1 hypothetical protein F997_01909 [Acinetobacter calcoaceticus NIPH 13]